MKLLDIAIKSLKSESRRVSKTSGGIYNPWQVLKVVVLTALSAVQGLWKDPLRALTPASGGRGDNPARWAIFEIP
ncbi:MAG: hypothetical protein ACK4OF_08315 [Aquificaceae bacterium]